MLLSAIRVVMFGLGLIAMASGLAAAAPSRAAHSESPWRRVVAGPESAPAGGHLGGSPGGAPDNYNFTGKDFDFSLTKKPHPREKPEPKEYPETAPSETKPAQKPKPEAEPGKGFLERGWDGTLDLFGLGA
jgi:hypothetical protein